MTTQKKVWIGVAVLVGLALMAPPLTAYANRQREAAKAEAQTARAQAAEAVRWAAMGDYYHRQAANAASSIVPVYDATDAMDRALEASKAPAAEPPPGRDWDAERARMTAEPGYSPPGSLPTASP